MTGGHNHIRGFEIRAVLLVDVKGPSHMAERINFAAPAKLGDEFYRHERPFFGPTPSRRRDVLLRIIEPRKPSDVSVLVDVNDRPCATAVEVVILLNHLPGDI